MGNSIYNMFNNNSTPPVNNSLMGLISMLKMGKNPQSFIQNIIAQNPQAKEAMNLLQGKSPQDLEKICRELCRQKGIDFDSTYQQIQNLMR